MIAADPAAGRPASSEIPAAGRVLGVDLGTARVGVAVSDGGQRLAIGATRLDRSSGPARADRTDGPARADLTDGHRRPEHGRREHRLEHRQLATLVEEYEAVGVVVGLPLSLSGAQGPAARSALDEVATLRASLRVPVVVVDERFSTVSATASLRAAGRTARRQRAVVDQTAAAVFLQVWLDRRAAGPVEVRQDG